MSEKKPEGPRYYSADRNPDNLFIGGVPLGDLTAEQFEALEPWQQATVDAQPFYLKSKPRATEAEKPTPAAKEKD